MINNKILLFCFFLFCFILPKIFSESEISSFTEQNIQIILETRIKVKNQNTTEEAKEIFNSLSKSIFSNLENVAIDYEQEKQILNNLFEIAWYEQTITNQNRAELRKKMKIAMKSSFKIIDERENEKINKWLYQTAADVTTYYMTRSVPATILYGLKVKEFYKLAAEKGNMAFSNCCLGNWNFFAPAPFGSDRKARKFYELAVKEVQTTAEKYLCYHYYSQFLFEKDDYEESKKYLQAAYDLNLGTKELDLTKEFNENGFSYLKFMRNRAGIDEEIPENEKDEEDK